MRLTKYKVFFIYIIKQDCPRTVCHNLPNLTCPKRSKKERYSKYLIENNGYRSPVQITARIANCNKNLPTLQPAVLKNRKKKSQNSWAGGFLKIYWSVRKNKGPRPAVLLFSVVMWFSPDHQYFNSRKTLNMGMSLTKLFT